MYEQVITLICALLVCAAITASYWRHRKSGSGQAPSGNAQDTEGRSVRGCIDEASSYFGIDAKSSQSRASHVLDLAPLKLASAIAWESTDKGPRSKPR